LNLFVREDTRLSGLLTEEIVAGRINLFYIPK